MKSYIGEYKVFILAILLSITALMLQKKYSLNVREILYQIKQKKNEQIELLSNKVIELNSRVLELQKQNQALSQYQEIYNKISKKWNKKAFLEIKYFNNNINGKYLIANASNIVNVNDLVVDKYNIFIGRIVAINNTNGNNIVKVQLLTDKKSNIPVIVNGADGIAFGSDDTDCKIEFQNLTDKDVYNDDVVLTSGTDNLTIRGIIAGKIKIIKNKICIENFNVNNFDKLMVID